MADDSLLRRYEGSAKIVMVTKHFRSCKAAKYRSK